MKRLTVPFLLFAGAFLSTLLLQKYTFIWQESDGLFLATGDYFSRMFPPGLHLGAVLGDFLSQFFRHSLYAPFIVGACVSVSSIFRQHLTLVFSRASLGVEAYLMSDSSAIYRSRIFINRVMVNFSACLT